jgi:hypothetical protein
MVKVGRKKINNDKYFDTEGVLDNRIEFVTAHVSVGA